MTRDDYVDLVERRYFGNVTHGDIPAVVACFTGDALVTIYHGDAAPRLFKAQAGAGETPLPRFFEHLLANYDPAIHRIRPLRGHSGRALRRDLPRHADAETGLVLSRRRRAALAQLQLLPLPGRAHPRDDHLLQQPRHRRRHGGSRRPPHRVSSGLAPGPHHGAMHGMHSPCHHRPCDARERTPPTSPRPSPPQGEEGELGGAACVPPPHFGGRGTGGGGPIVCAPLSRTRDPICCAHDPTGMRDSGAGDSGVQDSISRARPFGRARPRVSRRIPLIPLNPT